MLLTSVDVYNFPTLWRVKYEFADLLGGGYRVGYWLTQNCYTPPTIDQIAVGLKGLGVMVVGIESIEQVLEEFARRRFPREWRSESLQIFDLTGSHVTVYRIKYLGDGKLQCEGPGEIGTNTTPPQS